MARPGRPVAPRSAVVHHRAITALRAWPGTAPGRRAGSRPRCPCRPARNARRRRWPTVSGSSPNSSAWLRRGFAQPVADRQRGAGIIAVQQHQELLAAQPSDGVAAAHAGAQLVAEVPQCGVAGQVPVAVVDRLKKSRSNISAVKAAPGSRRAAFSFRLMRRRISARFQQPVRAVHRRHPGDRGLRPPAFGGIQPDVDDAAVGQG